jgi:hypothetical protein
VLSELHAVQRNFQELWGQGGAARDSLRLANELRDRGDTVVRARVIDKALRQRRAGSHLGVKVVPHGLNLKLKIQDRGQLRR